ncbi:uncharacterized protein V6R79_018787 [Siganus canaliculatus]
MLPLSLIGRRQRGTPPRPNKQQTGFSRVRCPPPPSSPPTGGELNPNIKRKASTDAVPAPTKHIISTEGGNKDEDESFLRGMRRQQNLMTDDETGEESLRCETEARRPTLCCWSERVIVAVFESDSAPCSTSSVSVIWKLVITADQSRHIVETAASGRFMAAWPNAAACLAVSSAAERGQRRDHMSRGSD